MRTRHVVIISLNVVGGVVRWRGCQRECIILSKICFHVFTTQVSVRSVCVSYLSVIVVGTLTSVKHNEFSYATSIRESTLLTPPNWIAVLHSTHPPHKLCEDIVCIMFVMLGLLATICFPEVDFFTSVELKEGFVH